MGKKLPIAKLEVSGYSKSAQEGNYHRDVRIVSLLSPVGIYVRVIKERFERRCLALYLSTVNCLLCMVVYTIMKVSHSTNGAARLRDFPVDAGNIAV